MKLREIFSISHSFYPRFVSWTFYSTILNYSNSIINYHKSFNFLFSIKSALCAQRLNIRLSQFIYSTSICETAHSISNTLRRHMLLFISAYMLFCKHKQLVDPHPFSITAQTAHICGKTWVMLQIYICFVQFYMYEYVLCVYTSLFKMCVQPNLKFTTISKCGERAIVGV